MKLFISIQILAALVIGITPSAYTALSDGIVAAWTFDDGKVTDAVGRAHGELFNAAKVVDDGKFGKALDVNGSKNTRAEIRFHPALETAIRGPHTVSYWLYVRKAGDHTGVWKGEQVGWGAFYTFRLVTINDTDMTFGTTRGKNEKWFNIKNCIEPGEWFHVCQVADGEKVRADVTRDGDEFRRRNTQHPAPKPYKLFRERPLELGTGRAIKGDPEENSFLDGMIDDVIIWDRALSKNEVAELAQGNRPDFSNRVLAVKAKGKVTTMWGKVKSYHHR